MDKRNAAASRGLTRGWILALVLASTGCSSGEVAEFFRETTPHEDYQRALALAGLHESRMGEHWLDAAAAALSSPLEIAFPYEEVGYFVASEPAALGYRLQLERGQRVEVDVQATSQGDEPPRVFLEVFEGTGGASAPRLLEYAAGDSAAFAFEPPDGGTFLIRVQPELLVEAAYRLTVRVDGALAFPVQGRGMSAVLSIFGDPREGGRRSHHGVDIFAPRNTPVLAVADGVVSRVEVTNLGGNVVWLRDPERRQSIYYAHLERQLVSEGQRVQKGDPVGLIGNSGNARTTPPHLHFGIYRRGRGPVDPWHHIRRLPTDLPVLAADSARVGDWVRVDTDGMRLRAGASRRTDVRAELTLGTPLQVVAVAGDWYRVRTPAGTEGFVAARLTEPATTAVATMVPNRTLELWNSIESRVPIDELPAAAEVPVLGEYDTYFLVSGASGRLGWVQADGQ
ncbi:MAG: peptidoglycan DD-metalloendopeptidase family protein [Gemmatimonadetes bacterium]|nr:peptidoglycan DD-metalloendopeptidase family protein [Gemmatimonadota bacterium]